MWIPSLIGKNYDEMVRMGLKLSKEDLYSINHSSLKDAIVQFGGGCTAEMVSSQGLLFTNHHCGYDAIASLSTVTNNYLANGFWAHRKEEELPAAGITVIFLQQIIDVTDDMNDAVGRMKGEKATQRRDAKRKALEERYSEHGKYVATVKEYFNGNQYLLLVYKKYTDVRLVGTPPESLGKFGGDTDNWMWPRHTADFSMFRVYAGPDNEPRAYSPDNVPYHPKKYLPISIKGVQEGDFTMIYGYPGRTNRYDVSTSIDLSITETNPDIVRIRDQRLAIMREHMQKNPAVDLKMASLYAQIANYWKYYIGQTEQLKRLRVVDMKKSQEQEFIRWAARNRNEYRGIFGEYTSAYNAYRPYVRTAVYYSECFRASALAKIAAALEPLEKALNADQPKGDSIKKYTDILVATRNANMKYYDPATEEDLLAATAQMYYRDVPRSQLPDIYDRVIFKKYGNSNDQKKTFTDYAHYVVTNTWLLDSTKFNEFVKRPSAQMIEQDPAAQYALSFVHNYNEYYLPRVTAFATAKAELSKRYMRGLMAFNRNKTFYPDANSTMRISYGKVLSYNPQDAVHFNYFTTLDGLVKKYKKNDPEFDAPKEIIQMNQKHDFGRWADADGSLHTDFITNNDITGGNSGSPVINGDGEYVGIAFDGNWEAMSGDISFDQNYKRTIVCDVRYMLFIIDRLGHAENLIEEMEIHD